MSHITAAAALLQYIAGTHMSNLIKLSNLLFRAICGSSPSFSFLSWVVCIHLYKSFHVADEFGRSQVFQQTSIVRRGKKSDDNQESNHDVHEHLRDDEVEDIIFRDDSQQPHSTFNADFDKISHSHVTSAKEGFKSNFDSKAGQRKSFNKHTSSNTINDIHTTQGKSHFIQHRILCISMLRFPHSLNSELMNRIYYGLKLLFKVN